MSVTGEAIRRPAATAIGETVSSTTEATAVAPKQSFPLFDRELSWIERQEEEKALKEKEGMEPTDVLPKRVVRYIHEVGVRTLDHLADNFEAAPPAAEGEEAAPNAVRRLVGQWEAMSTADKEEFVERVAISVVEVVAASAVLPLGLKLGKKAAKAAKKVIKKQTKRIRKAAKGKKARTAKGKKARAPK